MLPNQDCSPPAINGIHGACVDPLEVFVQSLANKAVEARILGRISFESLAVSVSVHDDEVGALAGIVTQCGIVDDIVVEAKMEAQLAIADNQRLGSGVLVEE